MELENMNINNVEEVADVIEEVVPKKGFKLTAGTGAIIGAVVTAAVIGVVGLVKKVRANKAAKEETEDDNNEYEDDYAEYDADVEDK